MPTLLGERIPSKESEPMQNELDIWLALNLRTAASKEMAALYGEPKTAKEKEIFVKWKR